MQYIAENYITLLLCLMQYIAYMLEKSDYYKFTRKHNPITCRKQQDKNHLLRSAFLHILENGLSNNFNPFIISM